MKTLLAGLLSLVFLSEAAAGNDATVHWKNKAKTPVASDRPVDLNVTPVASDRPVDLDVGDLQIVAELEQQVVGVAVSASGRVFVSFPRNGIDTVKNSVEEVINDKAVAYPNEDINTLNTAAPSTHFLSAQSVYVDSSDTLWVLDVGNLGSGTALISGGAKLVAIDLTINAVKRTIVFPDSLITEGASINDVRFDLARGAAGTIKNLGDKGEVGGLEADAQGRVYLTNGEFNAIRRFDPSQGTADTFNPTFETVVHNRHLVWPDSLALGKDGTLYITSTQVNRLPVFNAGQDLRRPPYFLYKVPTDATPGPPCSPNA